MIELLISAALAQTTGPVDAIVWARPFTLAVADVDPNERPVLGARQHQTFTEGWLVELRADPALLRPSNYAEPYLYVGERRAMRLNWDSAGGCLVAIVAGRPDLATTPIFLGAPPRADDDPTTLARAEAGRLGVQPLPAAAALAAGGPELQAHDLREVYAAGMARVTACTKTPTDLQRGAP